MDVPPHLTSLVREGRGVLLLGAGASLGSVDATGRVAPTSRELGELLADKFLGGTHRTEGLSIVGEYAISEADLVTVQAFIRDQFSGLRPTEAHALLPAFSWRGLATTNYDQLIEDAYRAASRPLQRPRVWLKDGDRIDDVRRDAAAVLLLKLHGCISLTDDPDLPLILTPDQYLTHRKRRERLFRQFDEWASEFSVIFIGHSLGDTDLRQLINDVCERVPSRPHFYAVLKNADEIVCRRWEAKRLTVIQGSFLEFLQSLDSSIPRGFRGVAPLAAGIPESAASLLCRPGASLPPGAMQFLTLDTELVKGARSGASELRVRDFYRGDSQGWAAIEAGLDVRRHLADEMLTDHFLIEESEHSSRMELVLIRAAAGAGKSVLLRRIAWDAAHEYGKQCLWLTPQGVLEVGAVREVLSATAGRVFLFVDSAGERVRELETLARRIGEAGKRLTVVIAERMNEWNISASSLGPFVTREY